MNGHYREGGLSSGVAFKKGSTVNIRAFDGTTLWFKSLELFL